jgi:hypothetical protein
MKSFYFIIGIIFGAAIVYAFELGRETRVIVETRFQSGELVEPKEIWGSIQERGCCMKDNTCQMLVSGCEKKCDTANDCFFSIK